MKLTELRLRSDDLSWRELDGEIVALDGGKSVYLGTNRTGALLWQRLAAGATHDDLVGALVDAFDVERDQARCDVDSFLGELRTNGLLES